MTWPDGSTAEQLAARRQPPARNRRAAVTTAAVLAAGVLAGAVLGRLVYLHWQAGRMRGMCEGPVANEGPSPMACPTFHHAATPGLVLGACAGLAIVLLVRAAKRAFTDPSI